MKLFGIFLSALWLFTAPPKSIHLSNPSFEDKPQDATVPTGWEACGLTSTPDIMPGFWGNNLRPSDGSTYIGLITRDNNSWEYIGQPLNVPMVKGNCYKLSLDLACASMYAGFEQPVILKVYAGTKKCYKQQLLFATPAIEHKNWKTYYFDFFPDKNHNYIIIEAFYKNGTEVTYKGSILIDNISTIKSCDKA